MSETVTYASIPIAYAGFWRRFAAAIIDSFWLGLLSYLPLKHEVYPVIETSGTIVQTILTSHSFKESDSISIPIDSTFIITILLFGLVYKLYYTLWESSKFQATPGKIALAIKVEDVDGKRLTFIKALARNMAKFVSSMFFCIGYMMVGWDAKKQALHDKLANTVVVRNKALKNA